MIEIKDLDFAYKSTHVLSHIDLTFERGNIYGLLGENGAGKTTLLKLICGLQSPQNGHCKVDGQESFERTPSFLQSIFFMPDEVTLPDNATPEKYIKNLAMFYPHFSQEDFEKMMGIMKVDWTKKFAEMSFGQQKKSLIACALSLNTDYVLLDEPTNGLDIPSKADFRRILSERVGNSTIIISTHQVKDVENLIDPIIILSNNAVLMNATVSEITKRLCFHYDTTRREDALYSEMMPGGWLNVVENRDGEESQINIEALFNAVLKTRIKI